MNENYELGLKYYDEEEDLDKAIDAFTKASEEGCSDAFYELGIIYLDNFKKKTDVALKYFLEAIRLGNEDALDEAIPFMLREDYNEQACKECIMGIIKRLNERTHSKDLEDFKKLFQVYIDREMLLRAPIEDEKIQWLLSLENEVNNVNLKNFILKVTPQNLPKVHTRKHRSKE